MAEQEVQLNIEIEQVRQAGEQLVHTPLEVSATRPYVTHAG